MKTQTEEIQLIHFMAQMVNQREALKQGYTAPTRWLCTRKDLQEKYLQMARDEFAEWKKDELDAKTRRDSVSYTIIGR